MDTPELESTVTEPAYDSPELKYADEFAQLSEEMSRSQEQPTLERIVALAVETIEACDYCGITQRKPDGQLSTPASTGPIVIEADRLQYQFDEGPCVAAVWNLDTYLIPDLELETRWPQWAPRAAQLGIRSVLSLRLDPTGDQHAFAALNLYAIAPDAFDNTDLAIASIFARHAGTALSGARTREELRTAIRSRQVIGVAQGMLMQRFGLTLDQSFEVLRRFSQNHNVKLRTLAEGLVKNGGIHDQGGDPLTVNSALERSFGIAGPPMRTEVRGPGSPRLPGRRRG
ncbi:GAF and ANTAR domain-containing protein [Microlunatus elymi]|uniref:GAF and ANTAR domain-containing protein n=1 Tax=Microlunatus elymi TaxID=2596828 RepID=A0A516Q207_9ACTN|nr:GAF and ANTAR domain-containing protein [Microlunatus elymi]QDP97470.1 GAF and ANTAR domain-containing protein [Microlunatus elymi]